MSPVVNIDFSGVSEDFQLPSEGEKICKVTKITLQDGPKGKYFKWELLVGLGPDKGSKLTHITSLVPAALFNLRNTIMACGVEVPKTVYKFNTDSCIGKILGVVVYHSEYEKDGQKKKSAKISELYPVVKDSTGWHRTNATQEVEDNLEQASASVDVMEEDAEEIDI